MLLVGRSVLLVLLVHAFSATGHPGPWDMLGARLFVMLRLRSCEKEARLHPTKKEERRNSNSQAPMREWNSPPGVAKTTPHSILLVRGFFQQMQHERVPHVCGTCGRYALQI